MTQHYEVEPGKIISMKPKRISWNIRMLIGLAAAFYLSVLLIQVVRRNYDLNKQVVALNTQIQSLQDEKDELNYKLQYYQTDSYKEKEARAKLGLQAPGEGVIILPRQNTTQTTTAKPAAKKSNWQQWMDFLLGRA